MSYQSQSVLFVCLGNICRSPTAHAVFRQKIKDSRLQVEIDSAGTSGYHVGASPDQRSAKHGKKRGYDFSQLFARAVVPQDFDHFDYVLAMDEQNRQDLMNSCPIEHQHKVQLFLDYANNYPNQNEVPDPYYGGEQGFEFVLDLVEDACDGLIKHLLEK